jgi:hypothetical protein
MAALQRGKSWRKAITGRIGLPEVKLNMVMSVRFVISALRKI